MFMFSGLVSTQWRYLSNTHELLYTYNCSEVKLSDVDVPFCFNQFLCVLPLSPLPTWTVFSANNLNNSVSTSSVMNQMKEIKHRQSARTYTFTYVSLNLILHEGSWETICWQNRFHKVMMLLQQVLVHQSKHAMLRS